MSVKSIIMAIGFATLVVGCAIIDRYSYEAANTPYLQAGGDPRSILELAYAKVRLDDGINQDEAKILADAYFSALISGCGATGRVFDQGDRWEIETKFGIAATPCDPIHVHKETGTITCNRAKTVKAPGRILENK